MVRLRPDQVFWRFHHSITATFDGYIATGDSSLAANLASDIHAVKLYWTRVLSENSEGKNFKLEFFDEAISRVIRQKAADFPPVTYQQNMLVQFCLHLLESSQNPIGSLSVQTLITSIGTQLISLRTQLLDFLQDGDETESANISATVARFTNLGCFTSAMAADAAERPAFPLDEHDLLSLRQLGVELISGILRADNDFDIHIDLIRLKAFKVLLTWYDEHSEFLTEEFCEEDDLYLSQDRLLSFCDSDWLELTDEEGEYPALAYKAEIAALLIFRNLAKRFGHRNLLRILSEYPEDWVESILNSLED